jgi:DNA polymerase-1
VWYAIAEHAEAAIASRDLVTLRRDVPIDVTIDDLRLGALDRERARSLFRALEFRNLVDELSAGAPAEEVAEPAIAVRYDTSPPADLDRLAEACRARGRMAIVACGDSQDPLRADLTGLAVSSAEGEATWIPLAPGDMAARDRVRRTLGPLLEDPGVAKVALDSKRAGHILGRHLVPVEGVALDVAVGAYLLDSSRTSYGLPRLVREHLGIEMAGEPKTLLDLADETRLPRAEEADLVFRLAAAVERGLEREELAELYRTIDGPLLPVLARMEARGIRVDVQRLAAMSREMEASLDILRCEIHALAGAPFNLDSPKQLREVLFDRLGLRSARKTAKGREASTDAQTLEALEGEHPIAKKLLDYRELSKLKGTYVDALPRLVHPDTGRVHTSFHPTGAATGRLSSSDPNLQNIPVRKAAGRKIREAFVPAEGHVFLSSDYSQIELRVLAHMCEDEELITAFRAGEDIHRHTAARIFEVPPEEVTAEMRIRAKTVNFGVLYGMSETRLAREQGIPRAEARRFIQAYFARFERVRGYIESVREVALREGSVRTLFGRLRRFPELRQRMQRAEQEQALRAAVNSTIQGTAADLMKMAMLRVDAELRQAGLEEARILLQVHDELLLEVPEGSADRARRLVKAAMEGVWPLLVPLVVDQKTGSSWHDVT